MHDRDTNKDGTLKKAHYHIVLVSPRGMSYQTAFKIASSIGGVRPEPVISEEGMEEYLTHENAKEKVQYNKEDIIWGNGLTKEQFVNVDKCILSDVFNFIRENGIYEYSDLINLLVDAGKEKLDYLQIAVEKAFAIQTYLRSAKFTMKGE